MADVMKRVKREIKSKKSKSADKKPNTQAIRRKQYNPILNSMQEDSQNYKILKRLIQKGSTTSFEIFQDFYIVNPQARIHDLRKKYGVDIKTNMVTKKGIDGKNVTYGKYTLEV